MDRVYQNTCQEHQGKSFLNACTDPNSKKILYCSDCFLEDYKKLDYRKFIPIKKLLHEELNVPLINWPPGMNQEVFEYLTKKSLDQKKVEFQKQINSFYEQMQSALNQEIEKSRKESINALNQLILDKNGPIQIYNQLSQKEELQQIFAQESDSLEKKYREFLRKYEQSWEQVSQTLLNCIQSQNNKEEIQLTQEQPELIQTILRSLISKISFFPQNSSQQKQIKRIENQENSDEQIVDTIADIISIYRGQQDSIKTALFQFKEQLESKRREVELFQQSINQKLEETKLQLDENLVTLMNDKSAEACLRQYSLILPNHSKHIPQIAEITELINNYKSLETHQQNETLNFMRNLKHNIKSEQNEQNNNLE